ncbi:MAG: FprA family A-type flavoprotein [Calditrichota bacterium]|jgi:flavorubredoxin
MSVQKIKENIFYVGAQDWDRTLFDAFIPLPNGTSYNAYLVKGDQKTALIDTVDPAKTETLFRNLETIGIKHIDYVISNHAEQDHSGSIPMVLERFANAQLVTGKKGQDMLLPLLNIPEERIRIVEDRENISLGNKTMEFIFAPWVHWPETMFTYLKEDQILFSCDLFGSHLATSQLYASQNPQALQEAKRYYAQIMMPYGSRIPKHLETLQTYQISLIAPSHGPIYDVPGKILNAYRDWTSEKVKNEVIMLHISMHGSTQTMVSHLIDRLVELGLTVKPYNMVSADLGEITLSLVDAATIILASPAVLMGAHPDIVYAAYLINALKPKTRFVGILGSFGWGNKMVNQLTEMMKDLKVEFLPAIMAKGHPRHEDFAALDNFAGTIAQKHQQLVGIIPN